MGDLNLHFSEPPVPLLVGPSKKRNKIKQDGESDVIRDMTGLTWSIGHKGVFDGLSRRLGPSPINCGIQMYSVFLTILKPYLRAGTLRSDWSSWMTFVSTSKGKFDWRVRCCWGLFFPCKLQGPHSCMLSPKHCALRHIVPAVSSSAMRIA